MPRDPSGTYNLPAGNPVVSGTTVEAQWANDTMNDLAAEMTDSLSRSGQGGLLGPLKIADGSVGAPGMAFNLEPTTGIYRAAAGDMRFGVLNSDILQLTNLAAAVNRALTVSHTVAGEVVLTVAASAGQTANILEVKDGTAAVVLSIPADGVPAADTDIARKKELDVTDANVAQNASDIATNAGNIAQNASDIAAHVTDLVNPHQVTPAQLDVYTKAETDQAIADNASPWEVSSVLTLKEQVDMNLDNDFIVAHGLAGTPHQVNVWYELRAGQVDGDYVAGDRVFVNASDPSSGSSRWWTVWSDGTNVGYSQNSTSNYYISRKDGASGFFMADGKWDLKCIATRYTGP